MALTDKAGWLTDLRSGKIQQSRDFIEEPDGSMCCLGVYAKRLGINRRVADDGYIQYQIPHIINGSRQGQWTGKEWPLGFGGLSDETASFLAKANTLKGWSFEQIADWIEKNLE